MNAVQYESLPPNPRIRPAIRLALGAAAVAMIAAGGPETARAQMGGTPTISTATTQSALSALGSTIAFSTVSTVLDRLPNELGLLSVHDTPRKIDEHSLIDASGNETSLADMRGDVLLVNFWATWCSPCRREMPYLDRLEASMANERFRVVPVSLDRRDKEKVRRFYDEVGIENLPIFFDDGRNLSRSTGATGLPASLIIDAEGREVARLIGEAAWDAPNVEAFFRDLAAARL